MFRSLQARFPAPLSSSRPSVFSTQISRRRSALLTAAVLLATVMAAGAHGQDVKRGRKYKAAPPTSRVEVTVIRASNGKPVENAAVVFHPLENGKDTGNLELKTNDEGKAVIDILAIGTSVRLQIIAPGFQTFGEDYNIDTDKLAIEVKLQRPAEQYSIYKKHKGDDDKAAPNKDDPPKSESKPDQSKPGDSKPDESKPDESKPDNAKTPDPPQPAPKDPPADDSKPQDPPPPK